MGVQPPPPAAIFGSSMRMRSRFFRAVTILFVGCLLIAAFYISLLPKVVYFQKLTGQVGSAASSVNPQERPCVDDADHNHYDCVVAGQLQCPNGEPVYNGLGCGIDSNKSCARCPHNSSSGHSSSKKSSSSSSGCPLALAPPG